MAPAVEEEGELLLLDRVKQTMAYVLEDMENLPEEDLAEAVERLIEGGEKSMEAVDLGSKDLKFAPVMKKGRAKKKAVNEWPCTCYEASGQFTFTTSKKVTVNIGFLSEEDYFNPPKEAESKSESKDDAEGKGGDDDDDDDDTEEDEDEDEDKGGKGRGKRRSLLGRRKDTKGKGKDAAQKKASIEKMEGGGMKVGHGESGHTKHGL